MLCTNCGKHEATGHYEININGKKRVFDLCAECAAEIMKNEGFDDFGGFGGFTLNPFESGIFDIFRPTVIEKQIARCEGCGATLAEIRKSGRVGCGQCYETFKAQLRPYINQIHRGGIHRGKLPHGADADLRKARREEELKQELTKAINAENFERAAAIRDELKQMNGGETK